MTRRRTLSAVLALLLIAAAVVVVLGRRADGPEPGPQPLAMRTAAEPTFAATVIARGLDAPTWVGSAPGDPAGTLWIVERGGKLLRAEGRRLERRVTWLDLTKQVSTGAEQGFLAIAFTPDFGESREAVLSWTDRAGDSQIELWNLGRSAGQARRLRSLLTVDQPFPNHNGGGIEFGPHRTLYAGFGDGGGAGDPSDSAQEPGRPLGKMLATDLSVPGEPKWTEVATGLRNPWRFWFDPALGEMWIGDVGQDLTEEIDRIRLDSSAPPANLGWSVYEGHHPFRDREIRGTQELTWPVASYEHQRGRCSVTGGRIYRGAAVTPLRGRYLFGDFCTGEIWTLLPGPGISADDLRVEPVIVPQMAHIGADADGELLIASLDGMIHRITSVR
jgi:glucose/arabinose dehydrogenase